LTIQSYLVYPEPGQSAAVAERLRSIAGCEVIPAQNREVFVLVTDGVAEDEVQAVEGITCLAMVGGWSE
jgi:hypothetical protein